MMNTSTDIRNAIASLLSEAVPAGQFYAHERYTSNMNQLVKIYVVDGEKGNNILGGFVRRIAQREYTHTNGSNRVETKWRIQVYQSFVDLQGGDDEQAEASELTFDRDVIDAVVNKFRDNQTLNGTVLTTAVNGAVGLQLEDSGPVMFAKVLCHGAKLTLNTEHFVAKTRPLDELGALSEVHVSQEPATGLAHKDEYELLYEG